MHSLTAMPFTLPKNYPKGSTVAGPARCRKYPSKIPFPVKAVDPEF